MEGMRDRGICLLIAAALLGGLISCGGGGSDDSGFSAGVGNVKVTGTFVSSQEGPTGLNQLFDDEEEPLLCEETTYTCEIQINDEDGKFLMSNGLVVSVPACNGLPVDGTAVPLGDYPLELSANSSNFLVSCSCLAAGADPLNVVPIFGEFSASGATSLEGGGGVDFNCQMTNLFDQVTGPEAQALAAQAGCFSLEFVLLPVLDAACGSLTEVGPEGRTSFPCKTIHPLVAITILSGCRPACEDVHCLSDADCEDGGTCSEDNCCTAPVKDYCIGCPGSCVELDGGKFKYCAYEACPAIGDGPGVWCGGDQSQVCLDLLDEFGFPTTFRCIQNTGFCCDPAPTGTCGNNTIEGGEVCDTNKFECGIPEGAKNPFCAVDCLSCAWCGDGVCNGMEGEIDCPEDCPETP